MKYFLSLFLSLLAFQSSAFAVENNILGLDETKIRNGDIHLEDIPGVLQSAIDFFMGIAGTIAVIFIIIGAYKILFGSLQQDKTKGRDTIFMALGGFAIAALAWFIVKLILSNLG
ncbi:pilin [Candidatus Gracilibacteria bacterium]|nr:pilin [Candidatus Gracilibacteria bacterium]